MSVLCKVTYFLKNIRILPQKYFYIGIKARRTRGRPKINHNSLWIEGRAGSVNQIIIENCLIGLNEVEVVGVFVVVLVGKDGKCGGNVWGKEKFLQESLQMWGKCGENWEI